MYLFLYYYKGRIRKFEKSEDLNIITKNGVSKDGSEDGEVGGVEQVFGRRVPPFRPLQSPPLLLPDCSPPDFLLQFLFRFVDAGTW